MISGKLYNISLVRPHLEFASVVWNPYVVGDIDVLERVQNRALNISSSKSGLSNEDRLKSWGITTLEKRRTRGDLIQMFKESDNLEQINWYTGPVAAQRSQTRAASFNEFRLEREIFSSRACNDY